jgi:hypothetical protein
MTLLKRLLLRTRQARTGEGKRGKVVICNHFSFVLVSAPCSEENTGEEQPKKTKQRELGMFDVWDEHKHIIDTQLKLFTSPGGLF